MCNFVHRLEGVGSDRLAPHGSRRKDAAFGGGGIVGVQQGGDVVDHFGGGLGEGGELVGVPVGLLDVVEADDAEVLGDR